MKYSAAIVTLTLITIGIVGIIENVSADGVPEIVNAYSMANLKKGAQLYDNWLVMSHKSPAGNHPLYPADSKKSGKVTWRCKECHGWDYIGSKGRYSKGSHFTGITGIYHVRTDPPDVLYKKITDVGASHDFSQYLMKSELWDLVKFLREGQKDIELVINAQGQAKGNVAQGRALYDAHCTSCHGADGKDIDFKSNQEGTQGVGWLANENPQESIHKIRWGHPGSDMPSMLSDKGLSDEEALDILAYSQSLGKGK